MAERAIELDFLRELRRVLDREGGGTDFFRFERAPAVGQLSALTAWLRTLPTGLGAADLEARARERWGPPPEP